VAYSPLGYVIYGTEYIDWLLEKVLEMMYGFVCSDEANGCAD
jgi:hypothetical protein